MRILVVDDEPLVAQTISLVFRKHGFEVETAYSAADALASARQTAPDLVLCDINMPIRDGVALMQDISVEHPGCPILVLTGSYAEIGRVAATASSSHQNVRILTKPCPPTALLHAAGLLLQQA